MKWSDRFAVRLLKRIMENTTKIPPYASLIVKLFQNVMYDDERKNWQDLITYQRPIREYFATIGVELILNEQDGFAFISQPDEMEGQNIGSYSRSSRRI